MDVTDHQRTFDGFVRLMTWFAVGVVVVLAVATATVPVVLGALPVGRNSPQRSAFGLYAEQLSGSPFTAPQATNQRTWLYRVRPTVRHTGRFEKVDCGLIRTAPAREDTDLPLYYAAGGGLTDLASACSGEGTRCR